MDWRERPKSESQPELRMMRERRRSEPELRITPTSALGYISRRGVEALISYEQQYEKVYDEDGNSIRPVSPLRRSLQPFESLADRLKRIHSAGTFVDPDAPSRLLGLPAELQFEVISYLRLGDLERLRRTCRFYHALLYPEFIKELLDAEVEGGFEYQLSSTCQNCLDAPGRRILIVQTAGLSRPNSPHQPTSKCFRCSVQARDLKVGSAVPLANTRTAWVCRWCGWPVVGQHSFASDQFHVHCYDNYYRVLWVFLLLGFAQFAVGVVAATLSLRYFRGELVVFVPTLINFVLLWVCMAFLMLRGNRVRTYHWVGFVELVILGLWIPPVYAVSTSLYRNPQGEALRSTIAALVFFALNMIFRLLNCIGNVILMFEYDMTKHYVPHITLSQKLINLLMTGLIYWTYPQCVEQRYPPDFN